MLRYLRISIEVLLIGTVAFTVLFFGGTPTWTWVVVEIAVALAVVCWALRMILERRLSYVKTPLNILLILLLFYIFFQLLPLPAGVLRTFQANTLRAQTVGPVPATAGMQAAASLPLDGAGRYPISLNRKRTRGHLLLYTAYVGFFLVLVNNIRDRRQLNRMFATVLATAAIVAIMGFATAEQDERLLYRRWSMGSLDEIPKFLNVNANPEFSAGYGFVFAEREGDRVDWYVPKAHGGDVFAGFPSSNSAGTVLVMGLVLACAVFLGYVSTRRAEWGQSGGLFYTREGNITLLVLFATALLGCGLALSKSRGAIVVAVALVPLLFILVGFSRSLLAGIITVVVIAVIVIAPVAVLGPSQVTGFVSEKAAVWLNPSEEEIRLTGREATRHIMSDFPLFGTGLGTFVNVYPSYKIRGPMLYFTHCDPLQWAAEVGLVGIILAGAVLLVGAWTVIAGWFRLKDPFFKRFLLGCVLGCAAFVAHGLVDFPLQIPGVVIIFVTLAGMSVVAARDRVARYEEEDSI